MDRAAQGVLSYAWPPLPPSNSLAASSNFECLDPVLSDALILSVERVAVGDRCAANHLSSLS